MGFRHVPDFIEGESPAWLGLAAGIAVVLIGGLLLLPKRPLLAGAVLAIPGAIKLLPLVLGFYVALSVLEDSGYLPRLATLVFHKMFWFSGQPQPHDQVFNRRALNQQGE